jgi:hypothetical protein
MLEGLAFLFLVVDRVERSPDSVVFVVEVATPEVYLVECELPLWFVEGVTERIVTLSAFGQKGI